MSNVDHPSHYQSETGIECIQAIEAALGYEGFIHFLRGQVIKYQWRGPKKNNAEDYEKAKWYSDKLVEHMKKGKPT